jgi:hypothetical protein
MAKDININSLFNDDTVFIFINAAVSARDESRNCTLRLSCANYIGKYANMASETLLYVCLANYKSKVKYANIAFQGETRETTQSFLPLASSRNAPAPRMPDVLNLL